MKNMKKIMAVTLVASSVVCGSAMAGNQITIVNQLKDSSGTEMTMTGVGWSDGLGLEGKNKTINYNESLPISVHNTSYTASYWISTFIERGTDVVGGGNGIGQRKNFGDNFDMSNAKGHFNQTYGKKGGCTVSFVTSSPSTITFLCATT